MTHGDSGHPGPDTMIQGALDRRNLRALFAALPLLKDLEADFLESITREIEWFSLPGGATLFSAGQLVDGLYVVVNGVLGVYSVGRCCCVHSTVVVVSAECIRAS
jgi:CRP-like cAMP-binding protein